MRLGLAFAPKPFVDERGVVRIHGKEMLVLDLDTTERLENQTAVLWCKGSLLTHRLEGEDEGLLTSEHVVDDADYLVVVVECEKALELGKQTTSRPSEDPVATARRGTDGRFGRDGAAENFSRPVRRARRPKGDDVPKSDLIRQLREDPFGSLEPK